MTSKKKLQAPWLLTPVWKDFPMTKGLGHHRTPVGIILAANEKLECFLESKTLIQVQVRLLNDDRETEGLFKVVNSLPGETAGLRVSSVSVPFVDCEYLKKAPEDERTISVSYPSDSKILPIYHFGESEGDFFKLWDTQDAEFAYVESDYFGLLIPKVDKEAARKLPDGKHLDDLIDFYDKIFTVYSELIGLSFEETGTNQNVRNRFFIKADKHGFGMAYYEESYNAVTSGSIESFWLDISPTNWGALHEIAHGHELKISDESLSVIETWNNILVFLYQTIMFGNDMATKTTKMEEFNIAEILDSNVPVKDWDFFPRCSFLTHMFLKCGQKSFARFNVLTRQEFAGSPYYASGTKLLEKLMHFFAIEYEMDMYPFMRLAKAVIGKEQLLEHYYGLANVAFPLCYLISDAKELNDVKKKLGLLFETTLVTPADLSSTNLKNDLSVKIDSKTFDVLSGDKLKLVDGSRVVVEKPILNQTVVLKDIPIGVYKVFVEPNIKNTKLMYDDFYALVNASKPNELFLSAKQMKVPSILPPDKINFLGAGGRMFASLTLDPFKHTARFYFFGDKPHFAFWNSPYASINIRNQKNEVNFSKVIIGTDSASGFIDINIEGETEIEIFHAETETRLKTDDPIMDAVLDRSGNTNYLILNERGLQNKIKTTPMELLEKVFLKKFEVAANKIRIKISSYIRPYCQPKYNLLLAVETFERLFRKSNVDASLRYKYKDCLPPVTVPTNCARDFSLGKESFGEYCIYEVANGNFFRKVEFPIETPASFLKFLGGNDDHMATLYLDHRNDRILFHVHSPKRHDTFGNGAYISVIIRNVNKEIIFSKEITGRDETQNIFTVSFVENIEIDVFHAEPARLVSENHEIENMINREDIRNCFIIKKSLSA